MTAQRRSSTTSRSAATSPAPLWGRAARFPSAGPRAGTLAVFHDVTEIRRVDRVRRDFIANASHELRTPLTSIQGYVENLASGPMTPAEVASHLVVIQRNAGRMRDLIDDLMDLSRIESGGGAPDPSRVDVVKLAQTLVADAKPRLAHARLEARVRSAVRADGVGRSQGPRAGARESPDQLDPLQRRGRHDHDRRRRTAPMRSRSRSRTPGSASPKTPSTGSSSASTASTPHAPARSARRDWASRSCGTWCRPWAARSGSRASSARDRASRSACPAPPIPPPADSRPTSTDSQLKTSDSPPTATSAFTVFPSANSPGRIRFASGSSTSRWIGALQRARAVLRIVADLGEEVLRRRR